MMALAALLLASAPVPAQAGQLFDAIKQRGSIRCGVSTGVSGFSTPDSTGSWSGIDTDICRALAAGLFGDKSKVTFTALSPQQRFTALQSGEVDLLSRNTTWSLSRDTAVGLNFGPITFYDGQAFMVPKSLGVTSATELDGATVCVQPGTTTEQNLTDFFRRHQISFEPVVIEAFDEINAAFFAGRCDAYTTDASGLAGVRATLATNPDDYVILPDLVSQEPLAPAVVHGDDQWFDYLKWTVFALIQAEQLGLTSDNIDKRLDDPDPNVQRFVGVSGDTGQMLGVDAKWSYNIVKQVGNYGELFERNLGQGSPLKLERGLNALWTEGGLMYAPPIR
ncbi:amino acid ABC transporter substrate-binding protein (plasmid) [Skermanella mucosa]|nr:amino acid ABC transporter substrate-binding protein [Skermanella mucosa]UEM25405.1 amino acid ABC transporter substrate-binding protein [Skermanella mucosa]